MEPVQTITSAENFENLTDNRLKEFLNRPFPFYLHDDRKNFLLVCVISGFVTAFLYLFKTSGDFGFMHSAQWMHGLITFGVLCFNLLLLPKLFPVWLDPVSWTVKKYIVFNGLHLFLIWVVATVVEKLFFCPLGMDWYEVASHTSLQIAVKGVIPIALTTLFLKAHMLQENLREAIRTNQELSKIQQLKKTNVHTERSSQKITLYSDTSESLTFHLPDLLFIEADDNYSTVVWKQGDSIQKKLLRINLKNIESQLNNSFALRCHRSYIVNINAISAITGNTNGYKLKINEANVSIPVSRPKGKEVMEKISQLRNVMELS